MSEQSPSLNLKMKLHVETFYYYLLRIILNLALCMKLVQG